MSVILPIIIFQFVGFELQNGAGEELHNPQRDVPHAIIRSGFTAAVFYVWGQLEKRNQDVVVELELGEGTEVVAGAGE